MKLSLVAFTLLCLATWMSSVHATNGMVVSCCQGLSNTRIRMDRVTNYTIHSAAVCPVRALVVYTKSGKRICADPNTPWAKRVIKTVDAKTAPLRLGRDGQVGTGEDNRGPAASTGPKKAPGKRPQNGKRRRGRGRKNRRGKKVQRKNV